MANGDLRDQILQLEAKIADLWEVTRARWAEIASLFAACQTGCQQNHSQSVSMSLSMGQAVSTRGRWTVHSRLRQLIFVPHATMNYLARLGYVYREFHFAPTWT